jgi:aspartyl-tRNA(Asn)/glutamyl-tRNA(Gln) amidotransferase subunit A
MFDLTLAELARGLQGGEFSSTELTRAYLQRIKTLDARYNSFITVTEEQALAQAEAADAARAAGAGGALCGLPIAHKDLFCTRGVRTSSASKMLDNFVSAA